MKLAIGTAQFGMKYGITNRTGVVKMQQIRSILEYAKINDIFTIDTAMSYGESEEKLGQCNLTNFKIITKLPPIKKTNLSIEQWFNNLLKNSLDLLNIECLTGLLLHNPADLDGAYSSEIINLLNKAKDSGLISKIGISVYNPQDLKRYLKLINLDIVQLPFNPLDQRFLREGSIDFLKSKDIEVHIRSIFLQGLLLMPNQQKFVKKDHQKYFKKWEQWCLSNSISPIEGVLRIVNSIENIDNIIVGLDNLEQFKEIIFYSKLEPINVPAELQCNDREIINPSNWSKNEK